MGSAIWIHADKRYMCSFGVNIYIHIREVCAVTTNVCGRISHHAGLMAPTYMDGCEHTWTQSGGRVPYMQVRYRMTGRISKTVK